VVFVGDSGTNLDAGAIMVQNPNATALSVGGVNVDLQRPGPTFGLWGTFSIPAHGTAILTQSVAYDFDTSEYAITACGVAAAPTDRPPKVSVTIAGVTTDYIDSGHVLDTSGYDKACQSNESTQWTTIGKTPCAGSSLVASPPSQAVAPGGTATVTAKFANSCGTALSGVSVNFAVTSGPNAGTTATATTNSVGVATFHYSGTPQGIDSVSASITNPVGTISAKAVNVLWETATLSVNPTSGLPGATIAFPAPSPGTATGYTAGETVDVRGNSTSGVILATVVADGSGNITGTFTVPIPTGGSALTGIVAVGRTSGRQGWAAFSSACSTDWTNAAGGNFNTASNWSSGAVPGSADLVCILLPGTYTVAVTTSESVGSLVLGSQTSGSQTLDVGGRNSSFLIAGDSLVNAFGVLSLSSPDGNASLVGGPGTLTNNGTLSTIQNNGSQRYIRTNVVNNGTVNIADFDTRMDGSNTFTNKGAMSIAASGGLSMTGGTFTQQAGTLAVNGAFSLNTATFNQNGGTGSGNAVVLTTSTLNDKLGAGSFLLQCTNTMGGTIPGGQKVTIQGNPCGNAGVTISGTGLTNSGTLVLDSTNGYYALIGGPPITNKGTLSTTVGNGGQRYLRSNITNATTGHITIGGFDTRIDASTTTINNGTFTVASTGGLSVSGGTAIFTQAAGTLTNSGSLTLNGVTFNNNGGATSGHSPVLLNSSLNDLGVPGSFLLECSDNLSGTIPSAATVTVQGNACGNADVTLTGAGLTNNGTLTLDSTNGNYALITGAPLLNNGVFNALLDNGGTRYIRVDTTNSATATMNIADFDTRIDSGNTTTNNGALTVSATGALAVTNGTFNQAAGSVTNTGSFSLNSTIFNQTGGTASGNPLFLTGATLNDTAGGSLFILQCNNSLGGTIPAGQTVNIQGNGCGAANTDLIGAGVTNNGTLLLDSTNANYALISGAPLTNNATFNTVDGAGGIRYLRVPVTNAGTMTIGAVDTRQDNATATTNNGTVTVLDGAKLNMSGGASYSQAASARLNVTVDAATGAFGILGGGGNVTVAGTLGVTTAGNPTLGHTYDVIANAVRSGTFSTVTTGATHYSVAYTASTVTLTRVA
jgi:hypothetical protein